jgi:integrase
MAVYNEKNKSKWTKDGRHWYYAISYTDIRGKKRIKYSKMYKDRATAEAEELKFKTKRDNPLLIKFEIVASEYFDYMYKIKKESTVYSYEIIFKKNIEPYFRDFYINSINLHQISFWKSEMANKGYKIAYLNNLINVLRGIFDYAMRNYGLETNVVAISGRFQETKEEVIEDKKKLRYITYDDFNKFISVIDNTMWKTFFIFLYYSGMRKGEVQALTWNDIDFDNNQIIVNKTLSIKTKKSSYKITSTKNYINRTIKMSRTLRDQLIDYKNECMKYSDFSDNWFVFGNSRFLPQITIDRYKHKYFKLANISEITTHEFRHSHVSLLINEYIKTSKEKNMKIDTTKFFLMMSNRMGHSINVMQRTYLHLFPTIQDEVVDLLDNL